MAVCNWLNCQLIGDFHATRFAYSGHKPRHKWTRKENNVVSIHVQFVFKWCAPMRLVVNMHASECSLEQIGHRLTAECLGDENLGYSVSSCDGRILSVVTSSHEGLWFHHYSSSELIVDRRVAPFHYSSVNFRHARSWRVGLSLKPLVAVSVVDIILGDLHEQFTSARRNQA